MRIKLLLLLLILVLPAAVTLEDCRSKPALCLVCDREIHPGMAATISIEGKSRKTCCVTCAMTYRAQHSGVSLVQVTDYARNKPADPKSATYVHGSNVEPCSVGSDAMRMDQSSAAYKCYDRCRPSILAFANRADAETFQREHGGMLMTLADLDKYYSNPNNQHKH